MSPHRLIIAQGAKEPFWRGHADDAIRYSVLRYVPPETLIASVVADR
jgi:hypothetical protein